MSEVVETDNYFVNTNDNTNKHGGCKEFKCDILKTFAMKSHSIYTWRPREKKDTRHTTTSRKHFAVENPCSKQGNK